MYGLGGFGMRLVVRIFCLLVGLYAALTAALIAVMYQPPERFAAVMAKTPPLLFPVLPFKPLWMMARSGSLEVGDAAPDFQLPTLDRKSEFQLSSFRGAKPVVLVFGSYT